MYRDDVDYDALSQNALNILLTTTDGNQRIGNLFRTDTGRKLVLESVYKVAELTSKRIKNLYKSQEFAVWFSNEYESRLGQRAPDKIVNLVREVVVNLMTPYKKLFFSGD